MSDALKSLHTVLIDALPGYDKAIADAETAEVRSVLASAAERHRAAHREIHALLAARGANPEDDGSFLATVRKGIVAARSAITGIDQGSLGAFAMGEEQIIRYYDAAIEDETDASARAMLQKQRQDVHEVATRMRAMEA
jgi:uncharacterized protein (TIGR02284 family)